MKTDIQPKYDKSVVTCGCGNTFETKSTTGDINVEICSACHPFYTGTMKFLDTAGRVDAFKAKMAGAKTKLVSKTEKRMAKKLKKLAEESARPESLAELRSAK